MKWKKLGLIFCPNNNFSWMVSHAANPIVEYIKDDFFRIYFSSRNSINQSSVGYIELSLLNPNKILKISNNPILSPGERGTFDDSGVSISCLVINNSKKYLYYLGWNLGVTVPWRNSIGLAVCNSNNTNFSPFSLAPIVDRNTQDPYSVSYSWVMLHNGIWKMWYGSNLKWGKKQTDMDHVIKYAESSDGITWNRKGVIAIDFKNDSEYALSKPCIVYEQGKYKMWYSYRGHKYRIGYAESADGVTWKRMDEKVGIDVSKEGWDSEMIEYPCVFDHKGKRYMLYNGNGYGKTGFGLAVLESD